MGNLSVFAFYVAAASGFLSWLWKARGLTGIPDHDTALRRQLRLILSSSFALLAAGLLVSTLLRRMTR